MKKIKDAGRQPFHLPLSPPAGRAERKRKRDPKKKKVRRGRSSFSAASVRLSQKKKKKKKKRGKRGRKSSFTWPIVPLCPPLAVTARRQWEKGRKKIHEKKGRERRVGIHASAAFYDPLLRHNPLGAGRGGGGKRLRKGERGRKRRKLVWLLHLVQYLHSGSGLSPGRPERRGRGGGRSFKKKGKWEKEREEHHLITEGRQLFMLSIIFQVFSAPVSRGEEEEGEKYWKGKGKRSFLFSAPLVGVVTPPSVEGEEELKKKKERKEGKRVATIAIPATLRCCVTRKGERRKV